VHRNYYGTVPVLAWIINHYFYGGLHYSWLAAEFAPMDRNPKSSNPYLIYGDLYWAWIKRDRFDKYVNGTQRTYAAVIRSRRDAGLMDQVTAVRLLRICLAESSVDLFYPIIYRVDMQEIATARQVLANSGLEGSSEVLVKDLRETEFDLLFTDNRQDELFVSLVLDERAESGRNDPLQVLARLEERVR
jgi:hypothetical protein